MSQVHSARATVKAKPHVSFQSGSNPDPPSHRRLASDQELDGPDRTEWSLQFREAFALLLQGFNYARQAGCGVWDFAVEIDDLKRRGLTNNDLRWMVYQGWIEQARELIDVAEPNRVFAFDRVFTFTQSACFVLSEGGVEVAERIHRGCFSSGALAGTGLLLHGSHVNGCTQDHLQLRPHWDPECHRLYLGNELVKEFKLPSPNQGTVLMAFEEEDWPSRIDDPLPCSRDVDPKLRLRSTIKSLNRNQKKRLIRFMGDGSGQGIIWEPASGKQA